MSQGGRFLRALSRIGYPKVGELEGDTMEWLFDWNSMVPFLEWFCDNIHASNVVSDEDLQRFDELHSSGAYILEKEQVDKTLAMLLNDEDECSNEALRNEVRTLTNEVESINHRLQKLVFQRNKLSLHQSSLGYKISKLSGVERHNKQKYKASLESSQADNKQINSSLEQLGRSVSALTTLYGESEGDQTRSLLSQLQYDSYHSSEEKFTSELTAYTRKQFFEGIADMAGREEKSRYELLEISDPTSLLVRGENCEVNLGDCQELSRLQSVYASSESTRIQNTVNAKGLSAAVEAAKEKAKNFTWETHTPDTDKMGAKLLEVQKALSQVKMEIRDLTERALPELVQDLGELQAISILKGDYNLKIARQDYFTSKQEQVITQLLLQRSRNEFLAMALEVEACKCRETHRLFSTLSATLGETVKSLEARTAIMEEHAHHSPSLTRATIDSRDHFMERLYTVLENPAERDGEERRTKEMFVAYNQLIELSQKLAGQLESLNVSLSSSSSEQDDAWKQLENHLQLCMKSVYGQSATTGGLPQLSPQRIFDSISQLDEVLVTLEHSIKDIIKDCEAKKKVLRSDSLKAMERELFVYFFTDPPRLKRAIAELSARVDAQIVSMKQ